MKSSTPALSLSEAKTKELVPCIGGVHLHSLHSPRREAEVFASNHLAHLSKTPNALILGLGFSYHIEEISKILRLKHKSFRIGVIEAFPELARLSSSYRGDVPGVEVFTAPSVEELWRNRKLGEFLLEKPVVIIHPASFAVAKDFYETFLKRRAPTVLGDWDPLAPEFEIFLAENASRSLAEVAASGAPGPQAAWMRAFWSASMQIENTRQLHLLVGKGALEALTTLNGHALKKKYPGEHIALVRQDDMIRAQNTGLFSEVHGLDMSYLQRSSFSPLLGDELAFAQFHAVLAPLTAQKWTRVFNTKGSAADTALSELFTTQHMVGACAKNTEKRCQEPTLKLLNQLDTWRMGHPVLQRWLMAKAFGQLDWTRTEVSLQKILDTKNAKHTNHLKSIVVGVNIPEARRVAPEKLELLEHLFTVVDLGSEDVSMTLLVDLVIVDDSVPAKNFWNLTLHMDNVDPDQLSETLGVSILRNLTKWASLACLFDYLGNARAALASEKIMARYDREALQQFLVGEVMTLKGFAKILLDGLRRQGSDMQRPLENYWCSHPGIITFTSAVELSLHSSVLPLLRNDQDVLAIKKRMRTLNQFYERIHKATALEMPKTDLGLTL